MYSISHLIRIDAGAPDVFAALTTNEKIDQWFTTTECDRWEAGSKVLWFGSTEMSITQIKDDDCVVLHVHQGSGWEGTDIKFAVEAEGDQTILRFDHLSWDTVTDHFRDCSMSWAYFLESLKLYLETGTGTPEELAPSCESS